LVINALEELQRRACTFNLLPQRRSGENLEGPSHLWNWTIDWLETFPRARWAATHIDEMERFITTLHHALWLIDGQAHKFEVLLKEWHIPDRLKAPMFWKLVDHASHQKRALPNLSASQLRAAAGALKRILDEEIWINMKQWEEVCDLVTKFTASLFAYADYLDESRLATQVGLFIIID